MATPTTPTSSSTTSDVIQVNNNSSLLHINMASDFPSLWQPRANMVSAPYSSNKWLLDSGATHHITSNRNNIANPQLYLGSEDVAIADGSNLSITHTGSASLPTLSDSITLSDVLFVPAVQKNLISVHKLCNTNHVSVEFFPTHFQVKDLITGTILLQGKTSNGLYEWPVQAPTASVKPSTAYYTSPATKASYEVWHSRLGHPSSTVMQNIFSQAVLPISSRESFHCSDCKLNKSHKLPFFTNTITSSFPLEYLYTDVWSSPIPSVDNYKYYLLIVDHYTRYCWLYPLKYKSDVKTTFITFSKLIENKLQRRIGTLYSDNGGEFIALREFLSSRGISHLTTPPHTPEHNGISERKHRHIVETGLTMLTQASMPRSFWTYAFTTAAYLINRLPSPTINGETPLQRLFGTAPNYEKLKVFGSLCYPWLRPYTKHKLEPRSARCVFLGYSQTQSAYICLEKSTGKIFISRHVTFTENEFPFAAPVSPTPESPITAAHPPQFIPAVTVPITSPSPSSSTSTSSSSPEITPAPVQSASPTISSSSTDDTIALSMPSSSPVAASPPSAAPPSLPEAAQQPVQPQPAQQPSPPRNQHRMITRSKNNISKPSTKLSLAVTTQKPKIPQSVPEALNSPEWRAAMCEEINSLIKTGTYELVPPHPSQNLVGTRWIFTLKHHPDGSLERYKARFVARGFNQIPGVDFGETFSPVVKSTTIRAVLHIAVSRKWHIQQLDVNNAFLQGKLEEEVFVAQPSGFVDRDRPSHVCKLHKALYGLKQAPRAWYLELRNHLISLGFTNSIADTSLFTYKRGTDIVYILVYVDDIIVTGSSQALIHHYVAALASRFSLKDLGTLRYFLGIEVSRTARGLHLCQRKYILDLLDRTNMSAAKPVSTPMQVSPKLTLHGGTSLDNPTEYRQVVGSLQYLAFTRPDIAFAVNKLSQFMHSPTDQHWQAVKRVLRYLAGTSTHGLFFRADSPFTLHAYSDADWAGDTDDFTSTNGYIIYLGMNPISWSARKQKGVARSSTEAEYRSVANTASELRWVQSLLSELGITTTTPPVIYCDNIGATHLSANPVFHSRMKHLALDYHFIRQQVENKHLRVSHISTKDQLADALTKALPKPRFQLIMSKIGVAQPPPS